MAKQIILYNLAPHVTEEQYEDYAAQETGPLLDSLESVTKFELRVPYRYVMHLTGLDDFMQKDAPSQKFQDFLAKWMPMVTDAQILFAEEVY